MADYEPIISELARIIQASCEAEEYSLAEEKFHTSSNEKDIWLMKGLLGQLAVEFEKYEGYYFSEFHALEPAFKNGKKLLWFNYLAQGGNPNAQEKP
ncbi:hypothetical protein [Methylotenera sp. G11]|uniref:hypothetical protein n=1 Tax=Methylotenera sp. G11 TaxID=1506585 RepID=UPI00126A77EE|nr:hypothetical protein [Methylotenera sp. G11]